MLLSILIPSLPERREMREALIQKISGCSQGKSIEFVVDETPRGIASTGSKRNSLIEKSKGIYFVFIDDDDDVPDEYFSEMLKAMVNFPDVITFNGIMTTDGANETQFEIRLNHPYINDPRDGKDYYLRFPNHLCPMKKELVKDFKFLDITMGEDYAWAKQIHDSGVLKTEYVIEKNMYHYKFISKK